MMSLRNKIIANSIFIIIVAMAVVSAMVWYSMTSVKDETVNNSKEIGKQVETTTSKELTAELQTHMMDIATLNAATYDETLAKLAGQVTLLSQVASDVYSNTQYYNPIHVDPPIFEKGGEITVQLLSAPDVNMNDADIQKEAGLMGNFSSLLTQVTEQSDEIASSFIASESRIFVIADDESATRFDDDGNLVLVDATKRPWYTGAKEKKDLYFTPVTPDVYGSGLSIMCGAPIYDNKEDFIGVAGAGMYLTDMEKTIKELDLGYSGYACVINNLGSVILSSKKDGELSVPGVSGLDLRDSNTPKLSEFINDALHGKASFQEMVIDDEAVYVAAAPMETVNWIFVTVISKADIMEPVNELVTQIDNDINGSVKKINDITSGTMRSLLVLAIVVTALSLVSSVYASKTSVKPVEYLTKKVSDVSGDNLDFKWDIKSDKETDFLGRTFEGLTIQLKEYINNLTEVTAEKERIGAELNIATNIQKEMLPRLNEDITDTKHYRLFASMDPAKEVGGDFYDFFKIDERHLALVVGDVSGKGVPAALFMVIAKTLVKEVTLLSSELRPSKILESVNNQMSEGNDSLMFCTCWLGILDIETGRLLSASAGHEYPFLKNKGQDFEVVKDPHGMAMAAMEGVKYKDFELMLSPGDTLFVYSDGVPEATDKDNELLGMDRTKDILNCAKDEAPQTITEHVSKAIDEFVGEAPQFDDITMLCIQMKEQA